MALILCDECCFRTRSQDDSPDLQSIPPVSLYFWTVITGETPASGNDLAWLIVRAKNLARRLTAIVIRLDGGVSGNAKDSKQDCESSRFGQIALMGKSTIHTFIVSVGNSGSVGESAGEGVAVDLITVIVWCIGFNTVKKSVLSDESKAD